MNHTHTMLGGENIPHTLESIDGSFLHAFDQAIDSELAKLHQNPFAEEGMKQARSFTPLSLVPQFRAALSPANMSQMTPAVQEFLAAMDRPYAYWTDLMNTETFSRLDFAKDGATFLASFRIKDYDRTGHESFTAIDLVVYLDTDGIIKTCPVVKKAIIAGGDSAPGGLARATKTRIANAKALGGIGVPTIHLYGDEADSAVVYETLYLNNKSEIISAMKQDPVLAEPYLPQLIDIAYKLDSHGYSILGFISDLIHDPVTNRFIYLDTGSDLGQPNSANGDPRCLRELFRTFPQSMDFIEKHYAEKGAISRNQADISEALVETLQ